jgi:hypothetical protein
MRDQRRADGRQEDSGDAVVHALPAHPHPPTGKVDAEEPITVCPWTPHV